MREMIDYSGSTWVLVSFGGERVRCYPALHLLQDVTRKEAHNSSYELSFSGAAVKRLMEMGGVHLVDGFTHYASAVQAAATQQAITVDQECFTAPPPRVPAIGDDVWYYQKDPTRDLYDNDTYSIGPLPATVFSLQSTGACPVLTLVVFCLNQQAVTRVINVYPDFPGVPRDKRWTWPEVQS